jgi:hypothetical protein
MPNRLWLAKKEIQAYSVPLATNGPVNRKHLDGVGKTTPVSQPDWRKVRECPLLANQTFLEVTKLLLTP